MKLPMANATLLQVTAAGGSEDYGRAAGGGDPVWTGSVGIYFHERVSLEQSGNTDSEVITRTLIVPAELPVDWRDGQMVSVQPAGGGDQVDGRVRVVSRSAYPGAPGTVRLELINA